ncbi:MAG: NUDIX domain-containing protein [Clostridia bacterium]|nr:NUDIX domain-containing protein [Clostridia bacterium]
MTEKREVWELYDRNRMKTGETAFRGDRIKQGRYHLVVHVWIRNEKNQYLISKRTPNKSYPNLWETVGGSALVGDDSLMAALREVKEEIGISLDCEKGKVIHSIKRDDDYCSHILDVWLFSDDSDICDVVYQKEEVCDAKWAYKEEIYDMIEKKTFVNVFDYIEKVFMLER